MLTDRTRSTLATLIAAFALIAAACGGDASTTTESSAPAADSSGPADSSGAESSADDSETDGGEASMPSETDEPDAVRVEAGSTDAARAAWPHRFVEDGVGGGIIDANDYEGQDLVLWFWAPW